MAESTFIDASESILATGGAPVKSPFWIQFFSQRQQKQWVSTEEEKKSWENRFSLRHMGLKNSWETSSVELLVSSNSMKMTFLIARRPFYKYNRLKSPISSITTIDLTNWRQVSLTAGSCELY